MPVRLLSVFCKLHECPLEHLPVGSARLTVTVPQMDRQSWLCLRSHSQEDVKTTPAIRVLLV